MGSVDGGEPVEIELVAHEPRPDRGSSRWRRSAGDEPPPRPRASPSSSPPSPSPPSAAAAPLPPPSPDGPSPAGGSERTRLVVTAGVVGVLALALGWLVGRSGSEDGGVALDDPPTDTAAATTLPLPFETLPIDGEEIDPGDFEAEPAPVTTIRRTPSTSVAVDGPTTEAVAVDGRLLGTPIRLVGVELGGALVEVDLATGTLTDFRARRIPSDGSGLVVGADWVLAGSSQPTRVVWSDGSETTVDVGDPWRPLQIPGTDLFWRAPFDAPPEGAGYVLTLVDIEGEPVGPTVELPLHTWPYLVDPASGGAVVGNLSRAYAITPDGAEYLGIGEIIGISETQLVTYDCDEQMVCSLYRTDRATGDVTLVPTDPALGEPFPRWQSMVGWGAGAGPAISPDGRWIALIGSTWRSSVAGVVDLGSGRFEELSRDSFPPNIVWSPDSRYAFALDGQVVTAFDTTTGETFDVFTDAVRWTQLGVRPLVPTTDEPPRVGTVVSEGSVPADEPVEG